MTKQEHIKIAKTLKGLKDFQSATVDYVYDQFYKHNRNKFLVADEVGLGKTIVAKGLLAMAYKNFKSTSNNKTFNAIYICSNQSLARQNLKKLNFLEDKDVIENPLTRLTYLALKRKSSNSGFKIDSLTPGTSLHLTNSAGVVDERGIIYSLLTYFSVFIERKNGLKWILRGTSSFENWQNIYRNYVNNRDAIHPKLFQKFRQNLMNTEVTQNDLPKCFETINRKEPISLWHILIKLCEIIDGRNEHLYNFKTEIVRKLRHTLIHSCLEYLDADIFILDEFQRYNELIKDYDDENISPTIELAKAVFSIPNTKILMLSATPFKPYTKNFEEISGEDHYKEFKNVLKFLINDKNEEYWKEMEEDRRELFNILRQPKVALNNHKATVVYKTRIESKLKESIVRTERVIVSDDKDNLIKNITQTPYKIIERDILDFVELDEINKHLKSKTRDFLPSPIEYSKSGPFTMSFLDNYNIKEKLKAKLGDLEFQKVLRKNSLTFIDLKEINSFKSLLDKSGNIPNAKLRSLFETTINKELWLLLWIAPSIYYYEPNGVYSRIKNSSKVLIFSSWVFVPRMISAILSYESERLTIGNPDTITEQETYDRRHYFLEKEEKRTPIAQFNFNFDKIKNVPLSLSNFTLIYPSISLSNLYNPKSNLKDKKNLADILTHIQDEIKILFEKHNLKKYETSNGEPDKWYWALPILLDLYNNTYRKNISKWLESSSEIFITEDEIEEDNQEEKANRDTSGKEKYFEYLSEIFKNPRKIGLGQVPDDLFRFAALMVLGSPAIAAYRSLSFYFRHGFDEIQLLNSAYKIADAFVKLFNKPESICIVRLESKEEIIYWQKVLNYCINGNIQSLLDEYIYLLNDCENITKPTDIAVNIRDVMGIRAVPLSVDDAESLIQKKKHTMRCHFAVDYGNQEVQTSSGADRMVNLRQSFNSPFRPFILSSTSIGQEGLDFHYYCRKIFHWNLPNNPVDLEQREGRINRYKGLVIRQNIVTKYLNKLETSDNCIWTNLFKIARQQEGNNKCELIPYWITNANDEIKIERFVPLLPFSKDLEKYKIIEKSLAFYRLTFGQPRQEELLNAIMNENLTESELEILRNEYMINLCPLFF